VIWQSKREATDLVAGEAKGKGVKRLEQILPGTWFNIKERKGSSLKLPFLSLGPVNPLLSFLSSLTQSQSLQIYSTPAQPLS
jgi:hypothetical protein